MRREYPNGQIRALKHAARFSQYEAEILDAVDEIERLQRLLMRSTDDGQRLLDAVAKLLSCPAIADEDFSDPEWGCAETREAEAFARAALAGKRET